MSASVLHKPSSSKSSGFGADDIKVGQGLAMSVVIDFSKKKPSVPSMNVVMDEGRYFHSATEIYWGRKRIQVYKYVYL